MWRFAVTVALCALGAAPVRAQAAHTPEAVRAAMTVLLQAEAQGHDSLRLALDSAAVWRDFVTCREVNGTPTCALLDSKPVTVIHVKMITPDSAAVEIQHFRMIYRVCGYGGGAIIPPQITGSSVGGAWWTMKYVDGQWVGKKSDWYVTC